MPIAFIYWLAIPIYLEVGLENLARSQLTLRTAERIKTLRREIDDISREVYQRLDDFDLIIEQIQAGSFHQLRANDAAHFEISVVDDRNKIDVAREPEPRPLGNFQDSCQACVDRRNLSRDERETIEKGRHRIPATRTRMALPSAVGSVCRRAANVTLKTSARPERVVQNEGEV